jgi:hypothetical protein
MWVFSRLLRPGHKFEPHSIITLFIIIKTTTWEQGSVPWRGEPKLAQNFKSPQGGMVLNLQHPGPPRLVPLSIP